MAEISFIMEHLKTVRKKIHRAESYISTSTALPKILSGVQTPTRYFQPAENRGTTTQFCLYKRCPNFGLP